jgi:hypothetical protein
MQLLVHRDESMSNDIKQFGALQAGGVRAVIDTGLQVTSRVVNTAWLLLIYPVFMRRC